MVKKTKGKHRLDKFYHLAKEQGYRSRAAFKLIQLNRKYNFLNECRAVLDLCAAPGGWLQVAVNVMPVASMVLGVDLVPIKPIRGAKTLVADITTQKCRQMIKKEAAGSLFNVVLHDGAPNVGGAWTTEAYTQSSLVLDALKLATEMLTPNGTFVTKIFRSKDYNALLYAFQQLFNKVDATKPAASRNASAEIFVVCLGYKAPSKIDPRLLDAKHLFQEVVEPPKNLGPEALIRQQMKQKRHREGYEEGVSLIHRPASALAFILAKSHVELLGRATRLELEGEAAETASAGGSDGEVALPEGVEARDLAAKIRTLPVTTPEIRQLCKDLQVLGRSEFKQLIKWRLQVRKELKEDLEGKAGGKAEKSVEVGEEEQLDPEEKLLQEMEELKDKLAQRGKKEKKKRREVKKKARVRAAQMAQTENVDLDNAPEAESLFRLKDVEGVSQLKRLAHAPAPGAQVLEMLEQPDSDEMVSEEESDLDTEDEAMRYEMQLEESMERSYQEFLKRKGAKEELARVARARLGKGGELEESEEDKDVLTEDEVEEDTRQQPKKKRKAGGGLLVELDTDRAGVARSSAAMTTQWFKQDLFADPNLLADEHGEDNRKSSKANGKKGKHKHGQGSDSDPDREEEDVVMLNGDASGEQSSDGEEDEGERPAKRRAPAVGPLDKGPSSVSLAKDNGELEVVPQDSDVGSDSASDSECEFDLLDDQGKAEVLALAKRMLRRKQKESIIDAAYNRYAFHDEGLPRWFREDEHRHMQPIPMVTKAEVEAEKEALRAIDARPLKKVAQAKARKQRRLAAKIQVANKKAAGIANQEDVPMRSKMKEIEKLYSKARASANKSGKGKKGASGPKGKPLDRRMKADLRGTKKIEARMKKSGKGRAKKGGSNAGGQAGGRTKGKGTRNRR